MLRRRHNKAVSIKRHYPGCAVEAKPPFDSFTQEGGGWAFSQKRPLRVEVGNSVRLEVPPTVYQRLGRSLLDRGRREVMSFRIPVHQFINPADEPEIVLHTGRARFELSSHAMEMLRDLIRRMTQP